MAYNVLPMLMPEVSVVEVNQMYTVWFLMMMITTMMIGMVLPNMNFAVQVLILILIRTSLL